MISPSRGTTRGRFVRLCGAKGVITATSELGEIIGPPALRLYAVEPVAVETSKPSAQYVFTNFSFL